MWDNQGKRKWKLKITNGENSGISAQAPIEADIRKALRHITTGKALGADNIQQVELESDI